MAYQVSTLVESVRTRVKDSSYSSTDIRQFLNDTQNDLANEFELPFFEDSDASVMTMDDALLYGSDPAPVRMQKPISVTMTASDKEQPLVYVDYRELDIRVPDWEAESSNVPRYYTVFDNEIYVYPRPDDGYDFTLRYLKRPTELTGDSSVPEIPEEFAELLVLGACDRVWQTKDRFDKAAIYENKYRREVQKLVARYSNRRGYGSHRMINQYTRSNRSASIFN